MDGKYRYVHDEKALECSRHERPEEDGHPAVQGPGGDGGRAALGVRHEPGHARAEADHPGGRRGGRRMFSVLMGEDVEARREFIQENAKYAFIDT
jgi:hypothetical protein